jgi:hypothetical protein
MIYYTICIIRLGRKQKVLAFEEREDQILTRMEHFEGLVDFLKNE